MCHVALLPDTIAANPIWGLGRWGWFRNDLLTIYLGAQDVSLLRWCISLQQRRQRREWERQSTWAINLGWDFRFYVTWLSYASCWTPSDRWAGLKKSHTFVFSVPRKPVWSCFDMSLGLANPNSVDIKHARNKRVGGWRRLRYDSSNFPIAAQSLSSFCMK